MQCCMLPAEGIILIEAVWHPLGSVLWVLLHTSPWQLPGKKDRDSRILDQMEIFHMVSRSNNGKHAGNIYRNSCLLWMITQLYQHYSNHRSFKFSISISTSISTLCISTYPTIQPREHFLQKIPLNKSDEAVIFLENAHSFSLINKLRS